MLTRVSPALLAVLVAALGGCGSEESGGSGTGGATSGGKGPGGEAAGESGMSGDGAGGDATGGNSAGGDATAGNGTGGDGDGADSAIGGAAGVSGAGDGAAGVSGAGDGAAGVSGAGGDATAGNGTGGDATGGNGTGGAVAGGCSGLQGPFERRALDPVPGPGVGTCGCDLGETCVSSVIVVDITGQETTTECVRTPVACAADRTCCCFDPCEGGLICSESTRPGALVCREEMSG